MLQDDKEVYQEFVLTLVLLDRQERRSVALAQLATAVAGTRIMAPVAVIREDLK